MKIKMLVMDVDGTLTDGHIYIAASGEVMKAFNVKDGYGIVKLSQEGVLPVIITGRKSEIVTERAKELNIAELYQEIDNKLEQLKKIAKKYSISSNEIAYIGDDMNDLDCIKFCGLTACPDDANEQIKKKVDLVCHYSGGCGAVREFTDYIRTINEQ
ncbi:KdsC family phosphatase [Anaerostipes faecalis]|uniref:KdsC family phosphatase n=1 Tax=Anaerostipes faecalis TaxID=2738446 RepID=UPI003F08BFA9